MRDDIAQRGQTRGKRWSFKHRRDENRRVPKTRKREFFAVFLTIASVVGTLLTLVGYGVALSVNDVFGMPHEVLFSSPFEVLEMSVFAVVEVLTKLAKLSFLSLYWLALKRLFPIVFGIFVILNLIAWLHRREAMITKAKDCIRAWVTPVLQPSLGDKPSHLAVKLGIYSTAFLLSVPMAGVLAILLIILATVLLSEAPIVGMEAGASYLKQYVIAPKSCAPIRDRAIRLHPKVPTSGPSEDLASCVRVWNEKSSLGCGRVVFATGSAIVLFDPSTGKVRRIPTRDAMVEPVGQLEPAC